MVDPLARVTAALVAGLLAGYGIAVPVGAIGTYLVALSARTSLRIGACAALGVATADGVYALVAVTGGSALTAALRPVLLPLRWASVAVLIALAVRGAVVAVRGHRERRAAAPSAPGADADADAPDANAPPPSAVRAYLGLWGVTLLNPLTVIYFAALVVGGGRQSAAGAPRQAAFAAAAFAASASWQLLLAGGGALLGRVLTGDRGRLLTALASSLLMAGLAVRLLPVLG